MEITTQLSFEDYRKWSFRVVMKQPITWVVMSGAILCIILGLLAPASKPTLIYGLILSVFYPSMLLLRASRLYKSLPLLREKTHYQFLGDKLIVKGESFESTFSWDRLYEVKVAYGCLVIYQSKYMASLIPLRDVWQGDLLKLKEILDRNKVKNNIKLT